MSAFICPPEHLGILAAYAVRCNCSIYEWHDDKEDNLVVAQRIAKYLARQNIKSVAHRYPEDKDGERPGPCLLDAEIEEAAAIYAAHFTDRWPGDVGLMQIIKLCDSYDYQACETPDWKSTLAWKQIDWIKGHAIRRLPGYDEAEWTFDHPLPTIEALYERHA